MTTTQSTTGRSTVVGVFQDKDKANEAVSALLSAGFRDDQVGFVAKDTRTGGTAGRAGTTDHGAGAATGAVAGGLFGALAGAAVSLLIPGVGPVLAGGILASAVGGAAVGAAAGGIIGALTGLGIPEEEARYYDEQFRAGRYVVTVKANGRYQEAYDILHRFGAYDYSARQSMGTATTASKGATMAKNRTDKGEIRVPEVEERLHVEKQPVQQGEVHITKEVRAEEQRVPVDVMKEEVHVEKRDVPPRPLQPGEEAFQEGTIRVPVHGEEVSARKEAVVTGEVVVNKERTTERQEVADTVRRTEVHVDQNRQEVAAPAGMDIYRSYATEMRGDPRFKGRHFEEIEADLQKDWTQRYPSTPWEKAKASIREAWTDLKSGV